MGVVVHMLDQDRPEPKPWRLLMWAALLGILFGALGLGEIAEDALRTGRNRLHPHKASGDIVLVKLDNQSLQEIGRWPWPRRYDAKLVDQLTAAGAKRIFFDVQFFTATNPTDDAAFAGSLKRSGRVVLPINGSVHSGSPTLDQPPLPMFARNAHTAGISWEYNYQNAVWRMPVAMISDGRPVPSFSALLAGRAGRPGTSFKVDYSLDPQTIPSLSASSVLKGEFDARAVRGKDIVIGSTSNVLGDIYFIPGFGQAGGVYIHIIGGETLKSGTPIDLGWVPYALLALLVSAGALLRKRPLEQTAILSVAAVIMLVGTSVLEANLVFLDVVPGLVVLMVVGAALAWRYYKRRGLVNELTGLPNLVALRSHSSGRNSALVAARVLNYPEIAAALPAEQERQLVQQIVSRLTVGAPNRLLFHGDAGIFGWFEDPGAAFGHHLEALSALFRNPVKVGNSAIDVSITFGVEIGSSRTLANRFASALVAADEAAHHGLKWKYHDPGSLENASWRLSMLSQLDEAIDRGEVWIAYQPKLDLQTRQIVGAEALARWTHPDKGPIAASEFVAAAEQHDRIGKLTNFVLEQAITAAAELNRRGPAFDIAVNISGKLLSERALVGRISLMLERAGLDPRHLTLELTESAALSEGGEALDALAKLRDLGITISIDDYGTGLSTLEYLRTVPAAEIKIDQSFVKSMVDNRSDRLMVQSTIALAHSLGRRVVAEGVESREILELLAEMGCDVAQGFVIGRPTSVDTLKRRLTSKRRQAA